MHCFKLLFIPICILAVQTEACQQRLKQQQSVVKPNITDVQTSKDTTMTALYTTWIESGIEAETGRIFRMRPNRGGFSQMIFNADGTVVDKGGLNCGFGKQFEGNFTIENEGKSIVAKYDRTTKYMGPDNAPEPIEVTQKFSIEKLNNTELVLIRYEETGEGRKMAFIKQEIWETLEAESGYPQR